MADPNLEQAAQPTDGGRGVRVGWKSLWIIVAVVVVMGFLVIVSAMYLDPVGLPPIGPPST